jgi:hypothetical protein
MAQLARWPRGHQPAFRDHGVMGKPSGQRRRRLSASTFEYARAVQAAIREEKRAAARSPFVPFVPKPPPPGWLDLESDIAEIFESLSSRSEEAEEALWRLALWLRKNRLSTPRVRELRRRRRLAEICRECPQPALPGRRRCQTHIDAGRERAKKQRAAAIAAGRCVWCSEQAIKERECPNHRKRKREQIRDARNEQEAAGLCTHGRCPEKATRGKYCQKHAEANVSRAMRWRRKGKAEGRCVRCTDLATHGVYCEAHAEENRERARQRPASTRARRAVKGA